MSDEAVFTVLGVISAVIIIAAANGHAIREFIDNRLEWRRTLRAGNERESSEKRLAAYVRTREEERVSGVFEIDTLRDTSKDEELSI